MSKKKAAVPKKGKVAAPEELNMVPEAALLPSTLGQNMKKAAPLKAKKMAGNFNMFEQAAENMQDLQDNYVEATYPRRPSVGAIEALPGSRHRSYILGAAATVLGPDHDYLQDRLTFPLKQLLTIMTKLNPSSENILDYSGCVQVTDAVFFAILQMLSFSDSVKFKMLSISDSVKSIMNSVTGLRLVGCHFLTDRGVECIPDCFPKLKQLYLSGCPNVTEMSLAVIAEKFSQLETLDICGTNVSILPQKLSHLNLVTDTCPMVAQDATAPSKDMAKVCVVQREGQSSTSILRLLQGDKDLSAAQSIGFKPNLACGKDCLINVVECSQTTLDLFTSGWAVYIIPSELKDKTKINEEVKSIFSIIQSVLFKSGTGAFIILGLNTAAAGVVPMDFVAERVQELAKDYASSLSPKAADEEPASFAHQLQLDQTERQRQCLKNLAISALEISVDQQDKAVSKLTERLAATCSMNPESRMFGKTLGDFMQSFPDTSGKDLKTGIHTLSGAAGFLLQGTTFKTSLEAQGAVLYLTKVGKMSSWRKANGNEIYASTAFVCQLLSSLLDPPFAGTKNNAQQTMISDDTIILQEAEVMERLNKAKITLSLLDQLIEEMGVIGMHVKALILFSCLPDTPDVSLDRFEKPKGGAASNCMQATYSFSLSAPVPMSLWHKALTNITLLNLPVCIWKHGVVLHDGIVELLMAVEGGTITLLAQTVSSLDQATNDRCVRMLWQCLEKYKLVLDQLFARGGYVPLIVSNADKPKPGGVTGSVDGHIMGTDRCKTCGQTKTRIAMLQDASAEIEPTLLSANNMKFYHEISAVEGGKVTGSAIHLSPGGTAVVSAGFTGLRSQSCSILLLKGNFDRLKIALSGSQGRTQVMIDNKETLSLTRKGGNGPQTVGKLNPGVAVNISMCPISESELDCIVDCHGEVLFQANVPMSRYRVDIHHINIEGKGNQPTPSDDIQFTVLSQNFGALGKSNIEVGMRLEALDKLTPRLICVATIADIRPEQAGKGGSLLIHFDGWTSRYDYWAEPDSTDLHPLGYMAEVGCFIGKYNETLQPPKNYGRSFDWAEYLKEESAEPVPYDFFTEEQKAGTKPDKTFSVCFELGLDYSRNANHQLCTNAMDQTTVLENWVRGELQKEVISDPLNLATFVKSNPRVFCLLPAGLDLQFLRYPSLAAMFQPEKQALHMMCSGQNSLFHLVDHPGLSFSSLSTSYGGLELFLQCAYLLLLINQNTMPLEGKELCKAFGTVPADQWYRLELGAKRMYRLYLMLFHFLADPASLQALNDKSQSTVLGQHTIQLKAVLEEGFKSHNMGQKFSHSAEFTKLECRAHQTANSVGLELITFPMEAFQGMSGTITWLDFSNNKLETLPEDFSTVFQNLTYFNLENNQLTSFPSMAGFKALSYLDVSSNQLKSIELTPNLKPSLAFLKISLNPLNGLPPSLSQLGPAFTELFVDNIGTIKSFNPVLGLKSLKTLSLNHNVITSLPDKLAELPLEVLKMAGVPLLPPLSSTSAELSVNAYLVFAKKNTAMTLMGEQELTAIFSEIDTDGDGHLGNEGILRLNCKLMAHFPRIGQVGKIPGANIPPVIFKMTNLVRLDMSFSGITTVSDEIKSLKNLNFLVLNGCHNLETLSAELATLPLKVIHLNDCLSLKTPPKEIVKRGFHAVYGYLKRLQMGSVPCKRTKLMMVGLGGAGKTSLVRALTKQKFFAEQNYDEMITDGIDIGHWEVPIEGEKEPLQYSVWDFAGQTVYYNTHQFFLSNRAVYLLLWNIRLGYEHAGLDFWLSSIACHAPKSPVLVVGTHCDKVERSRIPQAQLKKRFPQIASFHFVSSHTGEGLPHLREALITITLQQKYMGESIPEVWLNLETQLLSIRDSTDKALLPWKEVAQAAQKSGIFDRMELIQAVQFLHDLGSVQFFNTEFLRSNIVIIPQWIVDVMACIVTVHSGPVQNGYLKHEDMAEVWHKYQAELHPWLLRLTEEFDLTFPLNDKKANLIPCLLPDTEPEFKWKEVKREQGEREMKMTYRFDYLPAGLFNRAQVRLHQFSDHAIMWKKGSMLTKNGHVALLLQVGDTEVHVKAQGFKPENMLFLVHEVFECLISESYAGVHYDYLIPCMECMAQNSAEPCMFLRSKVQRAMEFKAPFLQCDTSFHILSIPEIQAQMPPDHTSNFDDHLSRSVHELHSLEEDVVISAFVCYSKKNVPSLADDGKVVNPATILEDLRAAGYKVSFTDEPETANMETLTLSMKQVQVVIIGISDDFVSNEQCHNLIIYTKETLNKPILLMTLGVTSNWQKQNINLFLSNEVYVKMQDITRYSSKIKELIAAVKMKAGLKKVETYPKCFISYCWANSKTAAELGSSSNPKAQGWGDPRKIKEFLASHNVPCWLDIEQIGQEGFFEDIAEGLRKAKVMVCCVSDEYAESKNCVMEYRFAMATLRIPVILAVVGTGYQWERSPVGMMAVGQGCPKINLQYENPAGLLELLKEVQAILEKDEGNKAQTAELSSNDQRKIAFQEVLELTERKFLRQLGMYVDAESEYEFPRLVLIDLVSKGNKEETTAPNGEVECKASGYIDEHGIAHELNPEEGERKVQTGEEQEMTAAASDQYCFRTLCEWEQGWHEVSSTIPFPQEAAENDTFLKSVAPYCARIMAILKHTSLPLPVLTSPEGEQLCKNFEDWSPRNSTEFQEEYKRLLEVVMQQDTKQTYGGLHRCHMSNGKHLWLCDKHRKNAGSVDDGGDGGGATKPSGSTDGGSLLDPKTMEGDTEVEERSREQAEEAQPAEEPQSPAQPTTSRSIKRRSTSERKLDRASSRACCLM